MKRTTISLPDEVARLAEREARRRGVSLSEVVREALAEHLGIRKGGKRPLPFARLGRSEYTDTSTRVDEVLAERWVADIERHRDR
jgi:Arc/MetJ-type ribon-helix-helix transcriptional regulator